MGKEVLPSLLILPPPPIPATTAAVKQAYGPPLAGALTALKSAQSPDAAVIEVILPCPGIFGRLKESRSLLFDEVEQLLARLYSLICIICAQNGIDTEGPDGVDARVILLAYDPSERFSGDAERPLQENMSGPIIDFPTLASTRRRWQTIFQVDGEAGFEFYTRYLNIVKRTSPPLHGRNHIVSEGTTMISQAPTATQKSNHSSITHNVVAVGGTFDHLHAGHKLLLTATALLLQPPNTGDSTPRRLIVGITGDDLLKKKKYAEQLQSWTARQDIVVEFLLSILSFIRPRPGNDEVDTASFDEPVANGRAIHTHVKSAGITIECVEIQDSFGPTITDESVSALVVSGETRSGGAAVNKRREEQGWKELEVFEVDVLDAQDDNAVATGTESFDSKISSTAIRKRIAERAQV